MKNKNLKSILVYSTMILTGSLLCAENIYAKTALEFECINNDNISEITSFSDEESEGLIAEFILPDYCFTGTGCTLEFDSNALTNIGKFNFGSGQEYFFLNQGTGLRFYELGGPNAVSEEIYNNKFNIIEISPSFSARGKAVVWMGGSEEEIRWLSFYSSTYLGFAIPPYEGMPFPEMFLTQGMIFTSTAKNELQLFYGTRKLEFEIEQGQIVTDLKIKSGDDDVTLEKIGDNFNVGSNVTANYKYRFNFKNLYKPSNEVLLEITHLKDYNTFNDALAVDNQTEVETIKTEKTLTFERSAFSNEVDFTNNFTVNYLARAEYYYCDSISNESITCIKGDFDPYLQLVYYKNNQVIGAEQVRVHDYSIYDMFDPESDIKMDDLDELNVTTDYVIPITVNVSNNPNSNVREADKIAYYLTDGKIEASSETMPSLSFGIGAGLQKEKRVD